MGILKRRLRAWDASPTNQRMVWAVATNLFHGAFRIGELLCAKSSEFDPNFELTTKDVHTTKEATQFRLKSPKEDRKGRRDCRRVRHREKHMPSTRLAEMDGHTQTLARLPASLQMGGREAFHPKPVQTDSKRQT